MADNIMAIRIDHRSQKAGDVQCILTKYGSIIKLRIGCHEINSESNGEDGIILLHINAETESLVDSLKNDLISIEKVTVQTLSI